MIEQVDDLWKHYQELDEVVCITTNGFVKKNGEAVCGRGCALEATRIIPDFAKMLGERIKQYGNVPGFMKTDPAEWGVFIYPVKHNWWEKASINLILASAHVLFERASENPSTKFYLPRPGCGNGRLSWEDDVKGVIQFLPDNVVVLSKEENAPHL